MAQMSCHGCHALIEDTELFCEHCGVPTIPQKTRCELQQMADREVEKSSTWTFRLGTVGALIGATISVAAGLIVAPILDPTYWIVGLCFQPIVFGFWGAFLGVIIDAVRARHWRK